MKLVWQIVKFLSKLTWTRIDTRHGYKIYSSTSCLILIHSHKIIRPTVPHHPVVPVNLVCMFCTDFGSANRKQKISHRLRGGGSADDDNDNELGPGAKTWQSIHSKTRSQSETVKLVTAKLLSQKPDDSVSLTLLDTLRKWVVLNKDLLF